MSRSATTRSPGSTGNGPRRRSTTSSGAAIPSRGPYTYLNGEKIRLFEAHRIDTAPSARPGEITATDGSGFTVAAGKGAIRIGKVRTEAGKQDAAAFAAERGLKRGDRFTAA